MSLLRPFADLEPCPRGPLYARGLEHYWAAFADPGRPRFALQRTLPAPFRAHFLAEAGLQAFDAEDPRDVPPALRTARWSAMCDALEAWTALDADRQCRLVLLLHALCFYAVIEARIPGDVRTRATGGGDAAELAYWGASARYVRGLPDRVAEYGEADLSDLESLATCVPPHEPAAFNAAIKVLTHRAKVGAPTGELIAWRDRAQRSLDAVTAKTDELTAALLSSRFHRAAAFVPQREGDREGVVRVMDLAERYARAMVPDGESQQLLYAENLHPLLESRAKEALWLGDLDLALARAQQVVDVDPYDSRAWLEVGQVRSRRDEWAAAAEAYVVAALLGPPASAIARHMAGLCFRRLGQPMIGAFFYQAALEADPRAISPREEIAALPDLPVLEALKAWSADSFSL